MLTFKASLTSELTMPKDANFDIAGHFVFETTHIANFLSLRYEKFKFTKTRILFSKSQKKRFDNKLNADHINLSCPLVDNTHYNLLTSIVNDKTVYQIEIGDTHLKCKATLHLNYINRFKLKLVHDLLKVPKWLKWLLEKIVDKGFDALFAIIIAFTSYKAGEYNGKQATKSDQQITTQSHDTTALQKEAVRNDNYNAYNNTDTFHSVPFSKDTAKQKDTTHKPQ